MGLSIQAGAEKYILADKISVHKGGGTFTLGPKGMVTTKMKYQKINWKSNNVKESFDSQIIKCVLQLPPGVALLWWVFGDIKA